MSDFISVYDVLIGFDSEKCPSIGALASALEDEKSDLYHFDDFGRLSKLSSVAERKFIVDELRSYSKKIAFAELKEVLALNEYIEEQHHENPLFMCGWLELPDFCATYDNWKVTKGVGGLELSEASFFDKSANEKSWDLFYAGLTVFIHQLEDHKALPYKEKQQKTQETIRSLISSTERCSYTREIINKIELHGFNVDSKTLRDMLRRLPHRLTI
jgi:hypothetical protein